MNPSNTEPKSAASPGAAILSTPSNVPPATPVESRTDDIVIGMGVTSSGKFTTAGSICVDGILTDADVEALALSISRGAEFHGKALVERVEIFGTLTGEVLASDQIVLRASAVVSGKIAAPYIVMHRGATISGEVKSLERTRSDVPLAAAPQRPAKSLLRRSISSFFMMVLLLLGASGGAAVAWWSGKPVDQPIVAEVRPINHSDR